MKKLNEYLINAGTKLDEFETHFYIAKELWNNTEIPTRLVVEHLEKAQKDLADSIKMLKKNCKEDSI